MENKGPKATVDALIPLFMKISHKSSRHKAFTHQPNLVFKNQGVGVSCATNTFLASPVTFLNS
jgi:hypothetical protein